VPCIYWFRAAGAFLLFLSGLLGLAAIRGCSVTQIAVDWNTTHQMIDGFGASATGYTGTVTSDQADKFFSSSTGLGLSLLRIKLIPGTADADCGCVANSTPYACVLGSKSQMVSGDLQIAELAAARGVRLFAAPWSPPAAMKSSGKYCTSGSLIGNSDNYTAYAADLASFPVLLNANGISIDAMSLQNEPNIENPAYDTCKWTAQQIHDFIPYLSRALRAAGFRSIKISVPEESGWTFELGKAALDDQNVATDVGLLFGHAYQTENPASVPSTNSLRIWQTETGDSGNYDGGMRDALRWARNIHHYMGAGVSAWMYWNLDCGATHFNEKNNMCLTDENGNLAKRGYVLGQYAKFIRPGWQRIDVTNRGSLLVTAYKGPGSKFAIVVINNSIWASTNQNFTLKGIASQHLQVTPWLTSASASLVAHSPVAVSSGGTFTYTIPADSVVTFEGRGD
jgi:glucuronoarabinoxylan endo-1,4-beta-xylanase